MSFKCKGSCTICISSLHACREQSCQQIQLSGAGPGACLGLHILELMGARKGDGVDVVAGQVEGGDAQVAHPGPQLELSLIVSSSAPVCVMPSDHQDLYHEDMRCRDIERMIWKGPQERGDMRSRELRELQGAQPNQ